MPRRTLSLVVLAALVAGSALTTALARPAAANTSDVPVVEYRPPSSAPIVDHFDLPARPWQAGNRGIDYGTDPAATVTASADGQVVFAGLVAGALHVTVLHPDGLRTSYSFLAEIRVQAGQKVHAGEVLGVTRGAFHFGVRDPAGTYLDPEALLSGLLGPHVRLVPGAEDGRDPLVERRSLLDTIRDKGQAALEFVADRGPEIVDLVVHYTTEANPIVHAVRGARALARWWAQQQDCTPGSTPAPVPTERRIAVVVSGLGTASDSNSAWEIDTGTLGYDEADVVRFSYAGGRAPGPSSSPPLLTTAGQGDRGSFLLDPDPELTDIPVSEFGSDDSQQVLTTSADRLETLLDEVAAAEPGVPIDVLAHSQGGVVARLAVVEAGEKHTLPPAVENLVTIGSPHQGAPLATAVRATEQTPGGQVLLDGLRGKGPLGNLDERLPAVDQLAETSGVLEDMRDTPIPESVRFTSLGGSGDLVVPGTATEDPQADVHRLIHTRISPHAHGDLASLPATTREIALAVAGRGPTCQSPFQAVGDFVEADTLRGTETAIGLAVAIEGAEASPTALALR